MAKPRPFVDPRIEQLPGQLRPVAEICGFDGVTRLLEHFAGQEIYVTTVANAGRSKIALKCGPLVARAVSEALAGHKTGRRVRIPLAKGLSTDAKHRAIITDRRAANAVAADLGMHVDSVHRIRAGRGRSAQPRPSAESHQPGLFDRQRR